MSNPRIVFTNATNLDDTLDKIITNAQGTLRTSIRRLENRIMVAFKELNTKGGSLVGPRVNLKTAQGVHKQVIKAFEEEYGTGLRRATKGFNEVAQAIQDNWPDLDEALQFTGFDRDVMKALEDQAYQEFVEFGNTAREKIATSMYDHVVANAPYADLVATMREVLGTAADARGYSMARYADQWANDAIMNFQQQVTLKKADDAGLDHFLYYGNIIRDSRPFCIDRAGKVFTHKEIESWNDLTWQGKSGPPMVYRGGYNCRHSWVAVKPEWVPNGSIEVGDFFTENGIEVKRGATIPPWPGKDGKPTKKRTPSPIAKKDRPTKLNAGYKDPFNRFVPTRRGKQMDAWVDDVFASGQEFVEWSGMGPCGPVADNIVEVLTAKGRKARVMYTTYLPEGGVAGDAFPHYVAVELDKADNIVRIYDPTNAYKRGVFDIKPGKRLPHEYQPLEKNLQDGKFGRYGIKGTVDEMRDDITVYDLGGWSRDDGFYSIEDHKWWCGRFNKPVTTRGRTVVVPLEDTGPRWHYTTDNKEIKMQLNDLVAPARESSLYPKDPEGNFIFSYDHTDAGLKRYAGNYDKTKKLHGVAKVSPYISSEAANAIGVKVAELQNTASRMGLPPLRCINVTSLTKKTMMGGMGDGVLSLQPSKFNDYYAGLEFNAAKYKANMKRFIDEGEGVLSTIEAASGKRSPAYRALKEELDKRRYEIAAIDQGTWVGPRYGGHAYGDASQWVPGNAGYKRPFNAVNYFDDGAGRANQVMDHEFGHHIHQQLFVNGDKVMYHVPPMENWLDFQFTVAQQELADRSLSQYSLKNGKEWFAENYGAWRNGKKYLVSPQLQGVMELLDDLEAGKINQGQLARKLWSGGDFRSSRYILPKAQGVYPVPAPIVGKTENVLLKGMRDAFADDNRRVTYGDLRNMLNAAGVNLDPFRFRDLVNGMVNKGILTKKGTIYHLAEVA